MESKEIHARMKRKNNDFLKCYHPLYVVEKPINRRIKDFSNVQSYVMILSYKTIKQKKKKCKKRQSILLYIYYECCETNKKLKVGPNQ